MVGVFEVIALAQLVLAHELEAVMRSVGVAPKQTQGHGVGWKILILRRKQLELRRSLIRHKHMRAFRQSPRIPSS